jgi:internalin A
MLIVGDDSSRWSIADDKVDLAPPDFNNIHLLRRIPGDARRVFAVNEHNQVLVYAFPDAKELRHWSVGRRVSGLAVSPDGAQVATHASDDARVSVWNAETGELVREIAADAKGVQAAGYSSDGQWLLTSGDDERLKVWSQKDGSLRLSSPAHGEKLVQILFAPQSSRFFTRSTFGRSRIKQWDLAMMLQSVPPPPASTPPPEPPVTHGQFVHDFYMSFGKDVGFIADGRLIFDGGNRLRVSDAATRDELWTMELGRPERLDVSADGRRFAAAYESEPPPGGERPPATVKVWSADDRRSHLVLATHSPEIAEVAFSPDGRTLAVAGGSEGKVSAAELSLWNAETGELRKRLPLSEEFITLVRFSPDGTRLAFADSESHYGLWDVAGASLIRRTKFAHPIHDLQFSPDGKSLVVCGGDDGHGALAIVDTASGTNRSFPAELPEEIVAAAYAPQGDLFVVVTRDPDNKCFCRFYRLPDGGEVRRLEIENPYSGCRIRFSPDGSQFLLSGGGVTLWRIDHLFDIPLQREIRKLADRKIKAGYVGDLLQFEFPDSGVTDRELAGFPNLGVPFAIKVKSDQMTDAGIAQFAKLEHIAGLDIGGDQLTQKVFPLVKQAPLRRLIAPTCLLSEADAVAAIGAMTSLETLHVAGRFSPDRKLDLEPLSKLTKLRDVRFDGFFAPGDSLRHFAGMSDARSLQFENSAFKDDDFKHLAALTRLHTLIIRGDGVFTGAGLKHLAESRDLEVVDFSDCAQVGDDGLQSLAQFKNLRRLWLSGTAAGDRGLAAIAGLTKLEYVGLPPQLTDAGLAHLANLTRLKSLRIFHPEVTDQGLSHLAKLTALEEFELSETNKISGSGLAALSGSALKILNLDDLEGITDDGLQGVARIKSLRGLHLPPQITVAGIKHVASLENLDDLDLSSAKLADDDVAVLTTLPKLKNLSFHEVPLTDAAIPHLAKLKSISRISMYKSKVTDAGEEKLKNSFPEGQSVSISVY